MRKLTAMMHEAPQAQLAERRCHTPPSVHRRLLAGAGWTLLGSAVARGAALVASFFVARALGAWDFGRLGAIESTVGMLAVFSNVGLSLTSTKYVAKYAQVEPARAGRVLGLAVVFSCCLAALVSIVVTAAAPWISRVTLAAPELCTPLRLSAAVLVLSSINGVFSGALTGLQAYKTIAKVNIAIGAITIPMLSVGALQAGLLGVIAALIAVQSLTIATHAIALWRAAAARGILITLRKSWRERRILATFSLPALLNSALRSPVHWFCIAMLVNQPGGFTEMGLLHAANPWFLLLMFLPGQLANVYYPMFEAALARNDVGEARQLVWKSVQLNAMVCSAAALALVVGSEWIAAGYGDEYLASASVMRISVVTGLIVALQQPLSAYLVAATNMWIVTACSLVWAIVCAASSYSLLSYGAAGIAAGRLAGYVFYSAIIVGLALPRLLEKSAPIAIEAPSGPLEQPVAA